MRHAFRQQPAGESTSTLTSLASRSAANYMYLRLRFRVAEAQLLREALHRMLP